MRIEGHDNGLAAEGTGALGHVAHDLLMRAMHAVEVAHADHGGPEVGRHFIEIAEDLHLYRLVLHPGCKALFHDGVGARPAIILLTIQTPASSPSYDRRTFSGRSSVCIFVREVVRDVGKECALRLKLLDDSQRILYS